MKKSVEEMIENLCENYKTMLDLAFEMSVDDNQFGDMQKTLFTSYSKMLVEQFHFSKMAAANICRVFIHLWNPEKSPYSKFDLKVIHEILQAELS